MDFRIVVLFSMAAIFFGFLLLILLKGPRQILNHIYSIFILNMVLWSFGLGMFYKTQDPKASLFWADFLYLAGSLIAAAFLHFSFVFPYGKMTLSRYKQFLIYVPNIVLFYLFFFTPIIIKGVTPPGIAKGFIYGPGHILWDLQFDIVFTSAFVRFFKSYKKCEGIVKMRLRYVMFGTLVGVILAGTTNVIMPWFNRFELLWLAPPLTITWLLSITYAILKYHLMDITVFALRGVLFIIVYGVLLFLPLVTLFAAKPGLEKIVIGSYALLAFSAPFVFMYLRKRAEAIMLRDQRRYQHILRELAKTMISIKDLGALLKTIATTMVDIVKLNFAGIYLKEDEYKSYQLKHSHPQEAKTRFQEFIPYDFPLVTLLSDKKVPLLGEVIGPQDKINLDHGLILPCFAREGLLGFVVLGAKANNQMYTPDDILVLENFAYSTGLAIENCRFWQEIETKQRKARLQEMDTYSYSLAHEIDNPVQVVIGQIDLLNKYLIKDIPEERRKDTEEAYSFILEAAKRVSGMVKAIRDFGSPTTGELKPLKINDIIESFSKLYLPQFKTNTVYFEKYLPEGTIYIKGEKPELMQSLVILANNAIHALLDTKEKKITLKVEPLNQDKVRIIFLDNGYGIKKEDLEIIFKPFVTTKASTEGTGMGLANAVKIIEKHKGRIWAESEGKGKGATFFIELPVAQDAKEEDLAYETNKTKRLF